MAERLKALGTLEDGTSYYAPLGELVYDEDDAVLCHLCGRWLRFVGGTHLTRTHGWTLEAYREAFQLMQKAPTCAPELSERHRVDALSRLGDDGFAVVGAAREKRTTRSEYRLPRWRSLAVARPDLLAELHPTRNGDLDPYSLGRGSTRKVWWRCAQGHEYQATVYSRTAGGGCAACWEQRRGVSLRVVSLERSLAALAPQLIAELHPTRNGTEFDPRTTGAGSSRRAWWLCGQCGHEWQATVASRSRAGRGCPRCRGSRPGEPSPVPYERSLASRRPDLAAELHPTRNPGIDATRMGACSAQVLWWRCAKCEHVWKTRVASRTAGSGCPACARLRALEDAARRRGPASVPFERSLAFNYPELVAELHATRSAHIDANTLAAHCGHKLWWQCRTCGHEWQAVVDRRTREGRGCPACAPKRCGETQSRVPPERSIAVKRPDLLAELHPTRNGDLDPYSLGTGSDRMAWWRCGSCGHEWHARVGSRRKTGCPRCAVKIGLAKREAGRTSRRS